MPQSLKNKLDTDKDQKPSTEKSDPAMSSQQKRFTSGGLATYKRFMVGESSWLSLIGLELYNLLLAPLPGLLGIGLRNFTLRPFLASCSGRLTIGRSVNLRLPQSTTIAKGAILDDSVTIDVRSSDEDPSEPKPGISIGERVFIGRNSILAAKGGRIDLARAVNISSHCRIATQTKVEIGESTLVAAYCYIGPGNHLPATADKALIEQEMEKKGGVTIGKNVWVGTRATILDGVKIGDGAIIGAHSLVREDVAPNTVVAGCPAKVIS